MIKTLLLVFAGGAAGAVLRELFMLVVPVLSRGFPLDILVANLLAAFLLGLISALHGLKIAPDSVYALIGTGLTGGLSTFSSFAYGSSVLMSQSKNSAVVALVYVLVSLLMGYFAVIAGLRTGEYRAGSRVG